MTTGEALGRSVNPKRTGHTWHLLVRSAWLDRKLEVQEACLHVLFGGFCPQFGHLVSFEQADRANANTLHAGSAQKRQPGGGPARPPKLTPARRWRADTDRFRGARPTGRASHGRRRPQPRRVGGLRCRVHRHPLLAQGEQAQNVPAASTNLADCRWRAGARSECAGIAPQRLFSADMVFRHTELDRCRAEGPRDIAATHDPQETRLEGETRQRLAPLCTPRGALGRRPLSRCQGAFLRRRRCSLVVEMGWPRQPFGQQPACNRIAKWKDARRRKTVKAAFGEPGDSRHQRLNSGLHSLGKRLSHDAVKNAVGNLVV